MKSRIFFFFYCYCVGENEPCSLNMNNQECGPGLTCAAASKNSKSDYICVKS
jgi:hypothetical protein